MTNYYLFSADPSVVAQGTCNSGDPAQPQHGSRRYNSDSTIANYTCDEGYFLQEGGVVYDYYIRSKVNGCWNGSDVECNSK